MSYKEKVRTVSIVIIILAGLVCFVTEANISPRFPVDGSGWYHIPGSFGHYPSSGVKGADDTYALDLNLGPKADSDKDKPVLAVDDGVVIQAEWVGKSGWWMLIKHSGFLQWKGRSYSEWYSGYLHMSNLANNPRTGARWTKNDTIKRGETIGPIGDYPAGSKKNYHLHFAIYVGDLARGSPSRQNAFLESIDPGQMAGPAFSGFKYGDLENGGAIYNHWIDEQEGQNPQHRFERDQAPTTVCPSQTNSSWCETSSFGFYGHMLATKVGKDKEENWGRWIHQPIPSKGKYRIYAFIPRNFGSTSKAKYEIYQNNTLKATKTVNQLNLADVWFLLGEWEFNAGDNVTVRLGDKTGENPGPNGCQPSSTCRYVAYDIIKVFRKIDKKMTQSSNPPPSDTTSPDTSITSGPSGTINTNSVTFQWTGSDNVTPTANLVYSYKLEGFDTNWSDFSSSTNKSYSGLNNGSYTFKVKAKDQAGNIDPMPAERSFSVNVPINRFPIADAGPDQTVQVGSRVELNARGSTDPDGDKLICRWRMLRRPSGSRTTPTPSTIRDCANPNTAQATFVADKVGDYLLELVVDDGRGGTASDQVKITAKTYITPPSLVTNFQASDNEDSRSTLTWTNPADSDLFQVIVKRKTTGYPTDHTDGETRLTIDSATPGRAETFVDTGLTNGTTYFYAVFSRDRASNWNNQVVEGKNADTATPRATPQPIPKLLAAIFKPLEPYHSVHIYQGDSRWEAIPGSLFEVGALALVEYDGALYAGTKWGPVTFTYHGQLYRYDGGGTWTLVCDRLGHGAIFLAVYKGYLYIGAFLHGGGSMGSILYRFDGPGKCTPAAKSSDQFISAHVWGDHLYIGGSFGPWRFDGIRLEHIPIVAFIRSFAVYNGELYAGTWGALYKTSDGTNWAIVLKEEGSFFPLEAFKGSLFMGAGRWGTELKRFDGTKLETVWRTTGDPIISMAAQGDTLYVGTGLYSIIYSIMLKMWAWTGVVYAYDGKTVRQISEKLGEGIHALYVVRGRVHGITDRDAVLGNIGVRSLQMPRSGGMRFIAEGQEVRSFQIRIFDLAGRLVFLTDWVDNGFEWDLLNDRGQRLANGVYLYVVYVRRWDGSVIRSEVRKLVVLR